MIYLCRHGETEFNREGRIQGHSESRLTDLGCRQAAAMGRRLRGLIAEESGSWRMVASPLGRTRQTAAAIGAALGLTPSFDPRLMEVGLGAWETMLRRDLAEAGRIDPSDRGWVFGAPGGETYDGLMDRVAGWLAEQGDLGDQRLIVVTHGVAGRLLRGAYAGLSREAALNQDIPQDAVFRLDCGRIDRIDCEM